MIPNSGEKISTMMGDSMLAIVSISKVYCTDEAFDASPTQDLSRSGRPWTQNQIGLIDLTNMV